MAHKIKFVDFQGFDLLNTLQVKDIIELFYRGGDCNFVITTVPSHPKFLADAAYNATTNTHTIRFCKKNILKFYDRQRSGGGDLPVEDIRAATASVLVHELAHCNQNLLHKDNGIYWGKLGGVNAKGQPRMKRYRGRACEREARMYADEKLNEICAYFNIPPQARQAAVRTEDHEELDDVIDLLAEIDNPTLDDIKDELRASGLLRPTNVMIVREELAKMGVLSDSAVVR